MFTKLFGRESGKQDDVNEASNASAESRDEQPQRWFETLRVWGKERLGEQNLAKYVDDHYLDHVLTNVMRLRSMLLTDAEFVKICRTTSEALIYRVCLLVEGNSAGCAIGKILGAVISILDEYPAYYSVDDVGQGNLTIKTFGKLTTFESELHARVCTMLGEDVSWYGAAHEKWTEVAKKFWSEQKEASRKA